VRAQQRLQQTLRVSVPSSQRWQDTGGTRGHALALELSRALLVHVLLLLATLPAAITLAVIADRLIILSGPRARSRVCSRQSPRLGAARVACGGCVGCGYSRRFFHFRRWRLRVVGFLLLACFLLLRGRGHFGRWVLAAGRREGRGGRGREGGDAVLVAVRCELWGRRGAGRRTQDRSGLAFGNVQGRLVQGSSACGREDECAPLVLKRVCRT
jgi:hypothetical protein